MSLLTLWRVEWSPPSANSPAVYLSVAARVAADRPSGTSHFISSRPALNGKVQIARWSRRMFRKKRLSSVGEGLACGVGCGSVFLCELCAEMFSVVRMMKAQIAARRDGLELARIFWRIFYSLEKRR